MQRLIDTVKESWSAFSVFLEWLLFFIIRAFPFLVLFGAILLVIVKIRKSYVRKHPKKHNTRVQTNTNVEQPTGYNCPQRPISPTVDSDKGSENN